MQDTLMLVERAENILIRECMESHGFEFHAPFDLVLETEARSEIELLTTELAMKSGYGIFLSPLASEKSELEQRETDYLESLTTAERDRYIEVLTGGEDTDYIEIETSEGAVFTTESGGCLRYATKAVFGADIKDVMGVFFELQQIANVDLPKSQDVVDAESLWKRCMSASGYYDVENPSEAMEGGIALRSELGTLSTEEMYLAAADAQCRIDSDIVSITKQTIIAKDAKFVDNNELLISIWAKFEQQMLNNAQEIWRSHGLTIDVTSNAIDSDASSHHSWCVCDPAIHSAMHFVSTSQACC